MYTQIQNLIHICKHNFSVWCIAAMSWSCRNILACSSHMFRVNEVECQCLHYGRLPRMTHTVTVLNPTCVLDQTVMYTKTHVFFIHLVFSLRGRWVWREAQCEMCCMYSKDKPLLPHCKITDGFHYNGWKIILCLSCRILGQPPSDKCCTRWKRNVIWYLSLTMKVSITLSGGRGPYGLEENIEGKRWNQNLLSLHLAQQLKLSGGNSLFKRQHKDSKCGCLLEPQSSFQVPHVHHQSHCKIYWIADVPHTHPYFWDLILGHNLLSHHSPWRMGTVIHNRTLA